MTQLTTKMAVVATVSVMFPLAKNYFLNLVKYYMIYGILCTMLLPYFCSWLDPLFYYGCRNDLKQSDLDTHPDEADSEKLHKQFNM